jgi:hypothetical protein
MNLIIRGNATKLCGQLVDLFETSVLVRVSWRSMVNRKAASLVLRGWPV